MLRTGLTFLCPREAPGTGTQLGGGRVRVQVLKQDPSYWTQHHSCKKWMSK